MSDRARFAVRFDEEAFAEDLIGADIASHGVRRGTLQGVGGSGVCAAMVRVLMHRPSSGTASASPAAAAASAAWS